MPSASAYWPDSPYALHPGCAAATSAALRRLLALGEGPDPFEWQVSLDIAWELVVHRGQLAEHVVSWLDFEHAGRNALAGDVANFLWYLLAMGGWLVPTYQASVYERTLCTPVPPVATPTINDLRVTTRRVEIDYTWHVGTGRRTALTTLLQRIAGDLGMAVAADGDLTGRLRPFLILRILGVIPLGQMSGPHAALCLAKLAELSSPDLTLPDWCEAAAVAPQKQPSHVTCEQVGRLPP